jgi:hypothetical protein
MKYIPQAAHPKGIRPSSKKVATFYDLEKFDWRSVSQKSKEIVLKKDEETGKPVIMVKDKPEPGEITVDDTGIDKTPEPTHQEINVAEPEGKPVEQPELSIDDQPVDIDTKLPSVTVDKVKPIESTENKKTFHLINPKTGASQEIEMTPKELIKQLKKMGPGWKLSDESEVVEPSEIEIATQEEGDYLKPGDKRNYLNRKGENIPIEIVDEDPEGGFYAKTKDGAEFKIPANRMQNIGQTIKNTQAKTKSKLKNIINKNSDLENIEASEI